MDEKIHKSNDKTVPPLFLVLKIFLTSNQEYLFLFQDITFFFLSKLDTIF